MQDLSCIDQPLVQSRHTVVGTTDVVAISIRTGLEINPELSLPRNTCWYLPLETKKTWPLGTSDLRPCSSPEAH